MRKGSTGQPFRALSKAQRRMLGRLITGWLYPLVSVAGVMAIRFLLPENSAITASVILALAVACGLSVMSAATVMHEKENGLIPAFYISGIKPWKYLLSKCFHAALSAVLCGLFIFWFADPAVLRVQNGVMDWASLLSGSLLRLGNASVLMAVISVSSLCLAMIPARLCRSMSGYTVGGAFLLGLLLVPPVVDQLFSLSQGFLFHPYVLAGRILHTPEMLELTASYETLLLPLCILPVFASFSLGIGRLCAGGLLQGKGGASE